MSVKSVVGGAIGFAVGGPAGAAIGAGIGGSMDASKQQAQAAQSAAATQAGMAQEGQRRDMRRSSPLLAVTRLAEGDEILVPNHSTLRHTVEKTIAGQGLRNGSPYGLTRR